MKQLDNFIDGEWVPPQAGQYLDNFNPSTGEVYSQLANSDELDLVMAIRSANKAFEAWSQTKVADRSKLLYAIADGIETRLDEFAEAESKDQGKPLWLAKEVDIPRAISNFRFFAGAILHHTEMSTQMDQEAINYSIRQPLGVAGLISPWNLPLYLLTWKIAPCLAVGNTAVCKPSELTSVSAGLLAEVFQAVDLPKGVCNMIFGLGPVVGEALVTHPSVPLISFTGGTATGERIQTQAASQFKKLSLELGGKNANIIFKDADLKKAVATSVKSSFLNQGEICLAGSRILVQDAVYDEFMDQFVSAVKQIKVGPYDQKDIFMGALVSAGHLDKVKSAISKAEAERGKILVGGDRPALNPANEKGYFINPTVIADLSPCSEIWQEEIFGPVVTVMPFKYAHEAVKWANTSPYGLSASIWTKDLSRAHKVAHQLNVGTVWVNTWLQRDLRMPFGGTKMSGIGREGGVHSIDFFTEQKTICIKL